MSPTSQWQAGSAAHGPRGDRAPARLTRVSDDLRTQTVGNWQLLQPLGEGRLSCVFLARPLDAAGDGSAAYAVKVLRTRWENNLRIVQLVRREALVGREVSHPHLISILAGQVHQPPYFIVMPRLEGATLEARLAAGRMSVAASLWVVRQVAEALDALDRAGWVHADVKPENIFLAPGGHATLLDLGFARRPDEEGSVADRPLVGTIDYLAPEMLTSTLRTDIRSDIYSLGVTLYRLLTGRLPLAAGSLAALVTAHRQRCPQDLRLLAPHVPAGVARLVHQMLAKEPLRRPQTPRELMDRLVRLEIESFARREAA